MGKERLMAFTDAVLAIVMTILVILLFFSSLIPYAIRFVNVDYNSSVTQGFYGIMVLLVTFSNVGLSRALEKANHDEKGYKWWNCRQQEALVLGYRYKSDSSGSYLDRISIGYDDQCINYNGFDDDSDREEN